MHIIIIDEYSELDPILEAAIAEHKASVLFRGQAKQRMLMDLAVMELRMASPVAESYAYEGIRDRDYEKNPPRVPKNLKQTKAPKHNFRAQMRSVNRNR